MLLSARYFTLFHWKFSRYFSTGSITPSAPPLLSYSLAYRALTLADQLMPILLARDDITQNIDNLIDCALNVRIKLRELIRLHDECVERADLEFGNGEWRDAASVRRDHAADFGERF